MRTSKCNVRMIYLYLYSEPVPVVSLRMTLPEHLVYMCSVYVRCVIKIAMGTRNVK